MSNMSLSAYVMGFKEQKNAADSPTPPQPDLNDILPQGIQELASNITSVQFLDYAERDIDVIEGEDF